MKVESREYKLLVNHEPLTRSAEAVIPHAARNEALSPSSAGTRYRVYFGEHCVGQFNLCDAGEGPAQLLRLAPIPGPPREA